MEKFDLGLLKKAGEDVYISPRAEIRRPHLAQIGNHVAIDSGFYCTTQLNLGDYIHISPHVSCIGGAEGIFSAAGFNNIMAGARIICVSDRFDDSGLFGAMIPEKYLGRRISKPVIMEAFSNLATNAVLLPGAILRQGALLSVGSVLMGDTEPWTVYKGNPAVPVKKINGSKMISYAKEMGYEF
jgi:acetyltransferase-like isoleucine patch superfamily enzyme